LWPWLWKVGFGAEVIVHALQPVEL
jgi:hypothetical protein